MIRRLSTMSDVEYSRWTKEYDNLLSIGVNGFKLLEPFKHFDSNGLKFPIEYLNAIGKYIVFLPLEVMGEYVDVVTKEMIDKNPYKYFLEDIEKINIHDTDTWEAINATGVGNLAYACLHLKNVTHLALCETLLNDINDKAKLELLTRIKA